MCSMIRIKYFSVLLSVLLNFGLSYAGSTQSAKLSLYDSKPISNNETFVILLTLTDFPKDYNPIKVIANTKVKGCKFADANLMSTFNNTSISGSDLYVSTSVVWQLFFKATSKAEVKLTFNFDGIETNKLNFRIFSGNKYSKSYNKDTSSKDVNKEIKIIPVLSMPEASVGQQVIYELRLLYTNPLQICKIDAKVEKAPKFDCFDAMRLSIYSNETGVMEYENKQYYYSVIDRWQITPLKEKTLKIGESEYMLQIVPTKVYNDLFFGSQYTPDFENAYTARLKANSKKLKVKGYFKPENKKNRKRGNVIPEHRKNKLSEGPVYHI